MDYKEDYKKHSLGRLKEWLHDCMSAAEASPQEIYDTIKEVVQEQYYYYKNGASKTDELLQLLNGQVVFNIDPAGNKVQCSIGDTSEYCKNSWNNFWEEHYYPEEVKDDGMRPWGHSDMEYLVANSKQKINYSKWYTKEELNEMCDATEKQDKVVKWQLPVEVDGISGEYFVCFPDDLLEAANLKEGDKVEWVDNGDGSYLLKKIENQSLNYDEMIAAGWEMTADGFWIRNNNETV